MMGEGSGKKFLKPQIGKELESYLTVTTMSSGVAFPGAVVTETLLAISSG